MTLFCTVRANVLWDAVIFMQPVASVAEVYVRPLEFAMLHIQQTNQKNSVGDI